CGERPDVFDPELAGELVDAPRTLRVRALRQTRHARGWRNSPPIVPERRPAVSTTNVATPAWDFEIDDPFALKAARVGAQAGATELGASLHELGSGAIASPLHFHHNNEELLIVLSGNPQRRRSNERQQLAAGDVIARPAGPDCAHRLENDGPDGASALI